MLVDKDGDPWDPCSWLYMRDKRGENTVKCSLSLLPSHSYHSLRADVISERSWSGGGSAPSGGMRRKKSCIQDKSIWIEKQEARKNILHAKICYRILDMHWIPKECIFAFLPRSLRPQDCETLSSCHPANRRWCALPRSQWVQLCVPEKKI